MTPDSYPGPSRRPAVAGSGGHARIARYAPHSRGSARPSGWIRIGELARRAGVTRATVHHYVEVGLLPEPVKTNDRMAYYDPAWVERLRLVRSLREQRAMPLAAIKRLLDRGGAEPLREVDSAILRPFLEGRRFTRAELLDECPVGDAVFDTLVAAGVLTAEGDGTLCADDLDVLRAVHTMAEAGLDAASGFDASALARHVEAVDQLIEHEFAVFNERLLGVVPPEEVARRAAVAIDSTSRLLAALHRRRLVQRLERASQRSEDRERGPSGPAAQPPGAGGTERASVTWEQT